MSRIQKFLLVLASLLFLVSIYGLFKFNFITVILLILFHSLCLVLFAYRSYHEGTQDVDVSLMPQEMGIKIAELEEKEKLIRDMEASLTQKETDVQLLQREKEDGQLHIGELMKKVESLKEELKVAAEKALSFETPAVSDHSTIIGLLPPLSGDEDVPSEVDLVALANDAKEELKADSKKANLVVSVSCASESLTVKADRNRLMILFRNIIDNSIKYMNRPGSLVITLSTIADDIFIVLKDTGEGLNEDETKHIFELNYQGSNRISGNGLGLAQAKAIVDYYGGTIYARSTEGKGMGIYIQLPSK